MLDILLLAGLGVIVCRILFAIFSSLESLFSTQNTFNPTEPIKLNPEPMKSKPNIKEECEFRQVKSFSFPADKCDNTLKQRGCQPCGTTIFRQSFDDDIWLQEKQTLINNYEAEMSQMKKEIEVMKEEKVYYIKKIEDIIENVNQVQEKEDRIAQSQKDCQEEEVCEENVRHIFELEESISDLQGKLACSEAERLHEREELMSCLKQTEEIANALREQLQRLSQISPVHPFHRFSLQKSHNFVLQSQNTHQNQHIQCKKELIECKNELIECRNELSNLTKEYSTLQSGSENANKIIMEQRVLIQKADQKLVCLSQSNSKQMDENKLILQRMQFNEEQLRQQIEELKGRLENKQKQVGQKLMTKLVEFPPQTHKREEGPMKEPMKEPINEPIKEPKLPGSVRIKTQMRHNNYSSSMTTESKFISAHQETKLMSAHYASQIATVVIFEDSGILNDQHKHFVAQEVKRIKKISLKKTKLLLKAGELSVEKQFHDLIDNLPNILLILRLVNGAILGAFTQTGFNREENEKTKALIANKSALMNISDEKIYPSIQSDASIGYSPDGFMWGKREFFFNCISMTLTCTFVENGVFWPSLNEVKDFIGEKEERVKQFQIYRLYLS